MRRVIAADPVSRRFLTRRIARVHCRGSCRRELIKLSFSRKHGRRFKRLLASLTFRITEFLVLSSLDSLGFSRGKFRRVVNATIAK